MFPYPADSRRISFDSDEGASSGNDVPDDVALLETARLIYPESFSSSFYHLSYLYLLASNFRRLSTLVRGLLFCLLPSYIQNKIAPVASVAGARMTNTIGSLDGLRGIACLFVFNEHFTYNFTNTFLYGYGVQDQRHLIQWPILRLPWSGFAMVSIFYVISGYVLSCKPLRQARSDDDNFQLSMSSAVFRRGIRLYLSPIIAIMLCAILVQLNVFKASAAVWDKDNNYLGLHEPLPPLYDGFIFQLYDALKVSFRLLNVWNWSDSLSAGDYDLHTWTIPVEFRCSMVLFLVLTATARLQELFRIIFVVISITFCIATDRKDVILFLAGMLIAELDMVRKHGGAGRLRAVRWLARFHRLAARIWPDGMLFFATGLFLASAPVLGCEYTPGFVNLSAIVPSSIENKANFLRSIGAIMITWAVANSNFFKPLFTNAVSSYLGKISFALYLVHGNVLKSVLYAFLPWIYAVTGAREDGAGLGRFMAAWALGLVLVLPVTFWVADLFWRAVDAPSVRFAKWVEESITKGEEECEFDYGEKRLPV